MVFGYCRLSPSLTFDSLTAVTATKAVVDFLFLGNFDIVGSDLLSVNQRKAKESLDKMTKKLFISHSSKTEDNEGLLQAVCTALGEGGAGHHVLVDKNGEIRPGDEWRTYLNEWMFECDAAIILFSRAAVKDSEWVKAESAILGWRRRNQTNFRLVGVLLDGMRSDDLKGDDFFRVIQLTEFQMIQTDSDESREDIINKIEDAFGDFAQSDTVESPFRGIAKQFRRLLGKCDKKDLTDCWEEIQSPHKPQLCDCQFDVAEAFTRLVFRNRKAALSLTKLFVKNLKSLLSEKDVKNLRKMVQGLWVNPHSAEVLRLASNKRRAASMNGNFQTGFTTKSYGQRLWPFPQQTQVVPMGAARNLEQVEATLSETFEDDLEGGTLKSYINGLEDPIFIVFKPQATDDEFAIQSELPDRQLLDTLQTEYEQLNIVIGMDESFMDRIDYIIPIDPKIDPTIENAMYKEFINIK